MKIIIIFLILFSLKSWSQPAGYSFGKQILLQSSQVAGSTDFTDFPVLVSFTDVDLRTTANSGGVEHANGYDIIFTLGDCSTVLDHEIEEYNATTGEYIAWVKIPVLSASTNTNIHMYYGNSSVAIDPSTTNVWSNDFVGVWHMNEDPSGSAPQMNESTSNGFHGSSTGSMTSDDLITSKIHVGLEFDGSNDAITRADNNTLDIGTNDLTLSAWINPDDVTAGNRMEIINKKNGGSSLNGYAIRLNGTMVEIAHKVAGQSNTNLTSSPISSIAAGAWSYVSVTFNVSGDSSTIHVNGVAEPSISINAGTSLANNVSLQIGRVNTGLYMEGKMDEVRVSNVSRTTDWVLTEYNNQNTPSMFYIVSAEMIAAVICTSLPIKLLNFNATVTNLDRIKLKWKTASEINNDYFTIERSNDGFDWEEIIIIGGAGNSSSLLSYSVIDNDPINGMSYYRLKQTDFNGQFEYYNIKSVKIEKLLSPKIEIYPNPTYYKITIIGNSSELEQINIFNALGQDISSFTTITEAKEEKFVIDLSNLTNGMYYIKTKTTTNKVYKQ